MNRMNIRNYLTQGNDVRRTGLAGKIRMCGCYVEDVDEMSK